jgi:serine/threonine protein phosphatase 1
MHRARRLQICKHEFSSKAIDRFTMSFLGFLKRRATGDQRTLPCVPEGERVYAIGDIHGRDDLFVQLLKMIEADNSAREPMRVTLILLGDLVDRGPDSASVVARSMALGAPFDRVHLLIGNHEEVFLKALGGSIEALRFFVRIGGEQTIHSYGIVGDDYLALDFPGLLGRLQAAVPQDHVAFLAAGEDQVEIGDYLFVHAGVRPGVPLTVQRSSDLRWIRDDFLNDTRDHGRFIVHGHTISDAPDLQQNRLGIDTGAFRSGTLTVAGFERDQRWLLSTSA